MNVGVPALLGLLFIGLKLTGVISWPWLWVLAPFWFGLAFLAAWALIVLGVIAVAAVLDSAFRNRTRFK